MQFVTQDLLLARFVETAYTQQLLKNAMMEVQEEQTMVAAPFAN